MKIRFLRPPPIKVEIAGEVIRVNFLRQSDAGPEDGGSIAAFMGETGNGHYLFSDPVPTFANLRACWERGFVPPTNVSIQIDRIVGGLIKQGIAEAVPEP